MTKGKEAAKSAARRYEAAVEHIDRLTDQLAAAKQRARDVEAQAARIPELERRLQEMDERMGADEVLRWALDEVDRYRKFIQDSRHQMRTLKLMGMEGWARYNHRILRMPGPNLVEFLVKKYPLAFADPPEWDDSEAPMGAKERAEVLHGKRLATDLFHPLRGVTEPVEKYLGVELEQVLETLRKDGEA